MGSESGSRAGRQFRFCIDRGGTFTDIYAEVPGEPGWRVEKLLSVDPGNYKDAPREGIRRILQEVTGKDIPRDVKVPTEEIDWIRMGTTVATNALLERKGERTALCVTKGFGDLLEIGNQARPKIFDLTVRKPSPLYERVIEVDERVQLALDSEGTSGEKASERGTASGNSGEEDGARQVQGVSGEYVDVVRPLEVEALRPALQAVLDEGIDSLAVVLMHSYTFPEHEQIIGDLAKEMGFKQVSLSSDLVPMVRIVPRGHTAAVDAYLTPNIQDYLKGFLSGFDDGLDEVTVSFMQSDGGLTPAKQFTGFKAILSGPAGGVVGYALTTFGVETEQPVIGFDMGGTSTDVSRYAGHYEQVVETQTAGVNIQAPQLDINTVAAGGGSKLFFQAGVFKVGPDSVGAHPGPVCYKKKGGELAVTDANLLLGRVLPDYFPKIFGPEENEPLEVDATRKAFKELAKEINAHRTAQGAGEPMSEEEVALGFLNVANEAMCRPIRQLTEMKGHDTSQHVLACFGGAGPQHACAIARALKMRTVLVHRYAGILSAYGMGLADVISEAQEPTKLTYSDASLSEIKERGARLEERVKSDLRRQGFGEKDIETDLLLNLRYEGTDTSIMVLPPKDGSQDYERAFVEQFKREYGFELRGRSVLVDDVRVHGTGRTNILRQQEIAEAGGPPEAEPNKARCYFESGWHDTPVYMLNKLQGGHTFEGPVVIMNGNSTILVEPGSSAAVTKYGNIRIDVGPIPAAGTHTSEPERPPAQPDTGSGTTSNQEEKAGQSSVSAGVSGRSVGTELDVVQLSIFNNRFMGIAEQMGRTLQRTSISTNIKERLDFSCALFSPDGGLVANAPHVPVHLGAMSNTVRWQKSHWGDNLHDGDVLVTNHPTAGGSHLPDITVVTPVFQDGKLVFFVASRGHHAEIGGITPGSMPPFSKFIYEEGAAIKAFKLVENGVFQEEGICAILTAKTKSEEADEDGKDVVIPGSRKVEDNLSDLRAQVAANQRGISLIGELINQYGLDVVQAYMRYVQENAEQAVREMLKGVVKRVADQGFVERTGENEVVLRARDYMDDGSTIALKLTIDGEKGEAEFDFEGTSPEVYGNWNAPEAVTAAAVIYCVRCLVDIDIPLNQGCLGPVTIKIPPGCFLSPSDKAAVVGGNVLTSQRITDVVLTAFQACACSQGCMNNLTFGDNTFGYYETIGGGCGAGPTWDGTSGVQVHMTNTRITDPEIFERRYPVLLHRFGLREGSGGAGEHRGGDGIERDIEFRKPVTVSILSERRVHAPHGLLGGSDGARGSNMLLKQDGRRVFIGGKNTIRVQAGDRLQILTPGGGGFGEPQGEAGKLLES
ncbi:oxoprolinase [Klebsormidium nitens]|uniref:Oxoprolinase n=1 Tax=Klebsormidium nitens TaxID=105231 RepID=A0A1Y1IM99_KLENI|nr:oxoprolinase [Klebsormidium nitens]|eukprot:GAQ91252.1 oxoprolinase [Klebsormidium nitens]